MTIHRLDLDIAIYRDRVQVTHRPTDTFVDQRAEYAFSSDISIVANPRYLEDTIVRAIRQVIATGGFSLRDPIARVVSCESPLDDEERAIVETALVETGMRKVVFELD
ncbi:hypothetical protein [Qipengyuania qiaonensis]|uniref:His-Xaa-Ser system protein HxsD n=1 Tax=Qipengyuania qiaonensis TaxID=2867240 RepID=A0ABS7J2T4_9SPHN|nr:hypothetical protein [Qipengyuania qiaonensis]MBX7481581.1 hypothetical protein [Qipengyuania qiaonensis]